MNRTPESDLDPQDTAFFVRAIKDKTTACYEAICVVEHLSELWDALFTKSGVEIATGKFVEWVVIKALEGPRGETQASVQAEWDRGEHDHAARRDLGLVELLVMSAGYATDAMKLESSGEVGAAWRSLCAANYWRGAVASLWSSKQDMPESIQSVARRANDARHAENRALKAQVLDWYSANGAMFSSKDDAALGAMKIVPVKYRTIRDWLKRAPSA